MAGAGNVEKLRDIAPGLYTLLNAVSRKRYGVPLTQLDWDRFRRLVYELLPDAAELVFRLVSCCNNT
jgi:hypothetical protein